jgi:hypothetical protein
VLEVTVERVIENLTRGAALAGDRTEPHPQEVFFWGDFDAVNRHFPATRLQSHSPLENQAEKYPRKRGALQTSL